MEVELVVSGLDGTIILTCVTTFDTEIDQIKTRIHEALGHEPILQRLIVGSVPTTTGQRLCDVSGAPAGSSLDVLLILRPQEQLDALDHLQSYDGMADSYNSLKLNLSDASRQWLQDADVELAELAIQRYGSWVLEFLHEGLRADARICLLAFNHQCNYQFGKTLFHVAPSLWSDRSFVFAALGRLRTQTPMGCIHAGFFGRCAIEMWQFLPLEIQSDREVVLAFLASSGCASDDNGAAVFTAIAKQWSSDRDVMESTLRHFGPAFRYASSNLRDDRELLLIAIVSPVPWGGYRRWFQEEHQFALCYASERLRSDSDIVLQAIQRNPHALEFAHESLRADRNVVKFSMAVNRGSSSLQYASLALRSDRELLLDLVDSGKPVLPYMAPECWEDDQLLAAILVRKPSTARQLGKHTEALIQAMGSNSAVANYIPPDHEASTEMELALAEAKMQNRDACHQKMTAATGRLRTADRTADGSEIVWEFEECTFLEELLFEKQQDQSWRKRHQRKKCFRNSCLHAIGRC